MNATAATILLMTGMAGPQNGPELLPAPKPALKIEERLPPLGFYRPNALDIWQIFSVNQSGQFRARVIEIPEGAFYVVDGEPYPWNIVNTRNHKPE